MAYLSGNSSLYNATVSGLNDIYCDNIYADGDITCDNIYSTTTTNLQDQINAIVEEITEDIGYWGSFYSTITQYNDPANTPRYMTVNNYDASNNDIVWYNNDGSGNYREIQVLNEGVYNVQFSVQLGHENSSKDDVLIWFRKNGLDVPDSASSVTLSGNGDDLIPSWNYIFNLVANDRIGIMWASSSTNMDLLAQPAQTSPFTAPAIPSVIITVQQIINTSKGATPDFSIGTVTSTGDSPPTVTLSGTILNPVLNFGLQRGPMGPQGPQGQQGPQGEQGPAGGLDPATALVISGLVSTVAEQQTAIDGLVTDVGSLDLTVSGLVTTVGEQQTAIDSLITDVGTLDTTVEGLTDDVTAINDKIINIVSAVPNVDTVFDGAIVTNEISSTTTMNIIGTTWATIQSPEISLNAGAAGAGTINIGSSIVDLIYIGGLPYVPFSTSTSFFTQF